jgi:hypothetical protein
LDYPAVVKHGNAKSSIYCLISRHFASGDLQLQCLITDGYIASQQFLVSQAVQPVLQQGNFVHLLVNNISTGGGCMS